MLYYLKGDATNPQTPGNKLIIHVANNKGGWGAGFVLALSSKWKEPEQHYRNLTNLTLGTVQYVPVTPEITVANMVAQNGYKSQSNPVPLSYKALYDCLIQVANKAQETNATVHMPRIGCNLGGGSWNKVEALLNSTLHNLDAYVYDLT